MRTPLTVGYLWLFVGWASFGEHLPKQRPSGDSLIPRLFDLTHLFGKASAVAALSFLAYLVGALLTLPLDGRIALFIRTYVPRTHVKEAAASKYFESIQARYKELLGDNPDPDDLDLMEVALRTSDADLRARLLVANQGLYGEYDRLISEASFRINLCLPLLGVAVVCFRDFYPLWALLSAAAAGFLLVQGVTRLDYGRGVLVRAIVAGVVVHPAQALLKDREDMTEALRARREIRDKEARDAEESVLRLNEMRSRQQGRLT